MTQDNTGHLPAGHWHDLVSTGSTAKILKALKKGQPVHMPAPINVSPRGEMISPLAYVHKWDWQRKHQNCMKALKALIQAGADPNMPDSIGRRPLHLALWLGPIYGLEGDVIKALIDAGADPALASAMGPNSIEMNAIDTCLLKLDMKSHGRGMLAILLDHCPGLSGRCSPSPLVTFAWNNSALDDQQCRQVCRMLMENGADPDAGTGAMPRTVREMPGRVREFVQEWEAEQRAIAQSQQMKKDTAAAGPSKGGARL